MKYPPFIIGGALALLSLYSQASVPTDPSILKGFAYANDREIVTTGDLDGDGKLETLLIDRSTGLIKHALSAGDGKWTWEAPFDSGLDGIDDSAVANFKDLSADSVALISNRQNTFQVVEMTGDPFSENHIVQGIAPTAISGMLLVPEFGKYSGVMIATNQNAFEGGGTGSGASPLPDPFQVEIIESNGSAFKSPPFNTEPSKYTLRDANCTIINPEVPTEYPNFIAIGRNAAGDKDYLILLDYRGDPFFAEPVELNSKYVLCPYKDSAPFSIICYVEGKEGIVAFHRDDAIVDKFTESAINYPNSQSISFIRPIVSEGEWRLLIAFKESDQLKMFRFADDQTLELVDDLILSGDFTAHHILNPVGEEIVVMGAPQGSAVSEKIQVYRYEDGAFKMLYQGDIPQLAPNTGQANLLLYSAEPFVEDSPALLASFEISDWTDGAAIKPAEIVVKTESYIDSETGLTMDPDETILPANTSGLTNTLVNQHRYDVSIVTMEAAIGSRLPDILATPEPGLHSKAISVTLTDSSGILTELYYRLSPSDAWKPYGGAIGPIFEATTVQAFGVVPTGQKTPIKSFGYTFTSPVDTLDSDGDGVPDFVENTYDMDLEGGDDTDGDTFSDLQEFLSGTNPDNPLSMPVFTVAFSNTTGFLINGSKRQLELYPHVRYLFKLTHLNDQYPFQFSEFEEGLNAKGDPSLMTHGVGAGKETYGEGSEPDFISLFIDSETPEDFFYFCPERVDSGNTISVVNQTDTRWSNAYTDGPFPIVEDNQFTLFVRPFSISPTGEMTFNSVNHEAEPNQSTNLTVWDTTGTTLGAGPTDNQLSNGGQMYEALLPQVPRDYGELLVLGTEKNFFIHKYSPASEDGRELVALTPLPGAIPALAPFVYDENASYLANASNWVLHMREVYQARETATLSKTIDYRDTLVLLMLEQLLNEILEVRPFVQGADTISLTPSRDSGSPASVNWKTLNGLRTPSVFDPQTGETNAFLILPMYQYIYDLIHSNNSTGPTRLRMFASEIYRVSAEKALLEGNEGKYRSPVDALRHFIQTGTIEEAYNSDIEGDYQYVRSRFNEALETALQEAWEASVRTIESHALYFRESLWDSECPVLENHLGETVALYDSKGVPFEFPESMRLTEGIEIQVIGFSIEKSDSCASHQLEVVEIEISKVPPPERLDEDKNLLLDNYELLVFGSIGQDPWGDKDGDGFSNLQEFLDGTNPISDTSFGITPVQISAPAVKITVIDENKIRLEFDFPPEYAHFLAFRLEGTDDLSNYWRSGYFAFQVDKFGHHQIDIDLTSIEYKFYRFMMELKGPSR